MNEQIKFFSRMLFTLMLCVGIVVACSEAPASIPVTGVTLDTEVLELVEGETGILNATVSPSNATNKNLLWISSN